MLSNVILDTTGTMEKRKGFSTARANYGDEILRSGIMIAKAIGVSEHTVWLIKEKRTWAEVA